MAYEVVMPYHLHMPSYFLETFTEYPYFCSIDSEKRFLWENWQSRFTPESMFHFFEKQNENNKKSS